MILLREVHRQRKMRTVVGIRRVLSNSGLLERLPHPASRTGLRWLGRVAMVSAGLITATSCATTTNPSIGLRGQRLEVAAVWSGTEQARFQQVLRAFEQQTGVVVNYTSASNTGVPTFLQHRLVAGRPSAGPVPVAVPAFPAPMARISDGRVRG